MVVLLYSWLLKIRVALLTICCCCWSYFWCCCVIGLLVVIDVFVVCCFAFMSMFLCFCCYVLVLECLFFYFVCRGVWECFDELDVMGDYVLGYVGKYEIYQVGVCDGGVGVLDDDDLDVFFVEV